MKLALVLAGGGTVGIAYHTGVLLALRDELGLSADDVDLVVGTSAGSVVGAYLRSGMEPDEVVAQVLGTEHGSGAAADPLPRVLDWMRGGPGAWARRGLGTAWVAGRALSSRWPVAFPVPAPPTALRRSFPAGLAAMAQSKERLRRDLGCSWPSRPLWLTTVDLVSGRRVVLGRHPCRLSLPDAVRASCAIPVLFPPVRMGRRLLVDGGVRSMAHLDLVAEAGVRAVIASLPLSYDPKAPPPRTQALVRRPGSRTLAREVAVARQAGASVLLIRPDAEVVRIQGSNMLRVDDLHRVVDVAYRSTRRRLAGRDRFVVDVRRRMAA
jgi:NTE family protein